MKHQRWLRNFAVAAVLLAGAACSLGVSVGVSNTPESPERKARPTLLHD